jgi:putative proteasome-type protease
MTYCIGLYLDEGLVMLSDSRTNAGVDYVSTFRKMFVWEKPGERVIGLMASGNLSVAQGVVNLLNEGIDFSEEEPQETLMSVASMFKAAQLVGRAVRQIYESDGEAMEAQGTPFNVSIILGGQIVGRRMRLFEIYSAGNFIEASEDTPFLQIGEHKYGKPILDRAATYRTGLVDAIKLSLISMDSTIRSNISVGLPLDLLVYRKDSLVVELNRRIEADDLYFIDVAQRWSMALRKAYQALPDPPFAKRKE